MDEEAKDDKMMEPESAPTNRDGNPRPDDSQGQNEGGLTRPFYSPQVRELELIRKSLDTLRGVKKGTKQPKARRTSNPRPAVRQAYQPKRPFWTVEGIGSESWKRLDLGAAGLLMEFYGKFNGYNRSDLSVTHRMVKDKMSSLIFTRWIWQLIGYGFLDVKRWGRLERNCSIYGLSDRWRSLSDNPSRLDEIQSLLREIDYLKKLPGDSTKRERMTALRKKICAFESVKG